MRVSRRDVVSSIGAGTLVATAGCLGPGGREPAGPGGIPPELVCQREDFTRLEQPFVEDTVSYTTLSADGMSLFELALDGRTIAFGSRLRVALRNVTSEPRATGPRHALSLQRETESGWQEVRGVDDGPPPASLVGTPGDAAGEPGDRVVHDPGEGFVWNLTLTDAGIAETHPSASLSVCPPLGAGQYRFVYWGAPAGPLAGEFKIVGPG